MFRKLLRAGVLPVAALLLLLATTGPDTGNAVTGIPDPCLSTASSNGGCLIVCPSGDADKLQDIGAIITVTILDASGVPLGAFPATDIWVQGCTGGLVAGAPLFGIQADAPTNAAGETTISGPIEAGGQDVGLSVVVMGVPLMESDCVNVLCLPYDAKSPDINGDTVVDLIDLSDFAVGYVSPPKPYQWELDFNCDSVVDLVDFTLFAAHYLHT